jgi:hypothetical protein
VKVPLVPILVLLVLAAASVGLGGLEGVGVLAIAGAFLVAFSFLLFRRATADLSVVKNRRTQDEKDFLWTVILTGMAVRVAVALALHLTGWNAKIAPDEHTFHENAVWFSWWMRGDVADPFSVKWGDSIQVGYFALSGFLYGTFGEYPLVPVLLNCVLGGLCAQPAYLIASRVCGRRAGRVAALLVTFFPSLVLWSALLIRDACVLFFLLWTACLAQSLVSRFRIRTAFWLVVCLAGLATLRSYLLILMAAATGISLLAAAVRRPGRAFIAAAVCGGAVLALVKFSDAGADFFSDTALQNLALRRQYNAYGGDASISLEGYDISTPMGALSYLPVGLAWFLLSPFPWQYAGNQRYAIPEVLIWYVCIPFVVMGAVFALRRRRRPALQPLVAGLLITLLYSLVEGNVGIIFRHRAQALALLLPFAAVGWARRKAVERARLRRTIAAAVRTATPAPRPVSVPA